MTKIKVTKKIEEATLVTHGGVFHADEVMATVILSKVFENVTVCRTFKVPEELSDDVIVYDIGYGQYDHHQKGGNGIRKNGVPYAACGLIWRDYGHHVIDTTYEPGLVWSIVDKSLIQGIDASDNGTMPKVDYPAQPMSVSNLISQFNPKWDTEEDSDEAFMKAVAFAENVFDNTLANANAQAKAKDIIEKAIENSKDHIMMLEQLVPWQGHLFASKNPKALDIQFVVFPSNRGGYNWQCVPDSLGGFGQRKPVPSEWKGVSGKKLQEVTGVSTATFCHPAGFIGGAESLEGAVEIAKIAVKS